jgi:hypothetical protein
MPTLTLWFLRSALVYLVVSLLLGAALALPHGAGLAAFAPVYVHLFMVGWVTQMIFGVAYWMFPRVAPNQPRGRERLALISYITLNVGLIGRAVAEPLQSSHPGPLLGGVLITSGVCQWLAAVLFAVNTWPRVKAR